MTDCISVTVQCCNTIKSFYVPPSVSITVLICPYVLSSSSVPPSIVKLNEPERRHDTCIEFTVRGSPHPTLRWFYKDKVCFFFLSMYGTFFPYLNSRVWSFNWTNSVIDFTFRFCSSFLQILPLCSSSPCLCLDVLCFCSNCKLLVFIVACSSFSPSPRIQAASGAVSVECQG